jgi:diguanylate cyclase (GGDEF)-like protein
MTARHISTGLRIVALGGAILLFLIAGPAELVRLRPADLGAIAGLAALACIVALQRSPGVLFERGVRQTPSLRIALIVPMLSAAFALFGWYEAALIHTLAHLANNAGGRRRSPFDRLLVAFSRVPIWWLFAHLQPFAAPSAAAFGVRGFALFVAVNAAWFFAMTLLWTDVLIALRSRRSLLALWRTQLSDLPSYARFVAEVAWGYVGVAVFLSGGALLGVAVFIPVALIANLSAQVAFATSRVHRLTLSREAVEAMLESNDPLPQLRSLLEAIDVRLTREPIEIFGFGRGGNVGWASVTRIGPPIPAALTRAAGRALYDLQAHGGSVEGVRTHDGMVLAYASHDAERRLLGALVVYRTPGAPVVIAAREFERAAQERAPLLSDFGTIAATRTAASVDTLTGLVNRRAVGRAVDEAMRHVRTGGSFAMLMLDIDHFKSINDMLGHTAGDRALQRIGAVIGKSVREGDVAGRFGGEEFIVLMRDAGRDRAMAVAERLRSEIENCGVYYADGKPITISIGVAYLLEDDPSGEAVIERADRALYRAKHTGRNRVVESPLTVA